MKRSQPREVILEELRKLKSHPRGDELYDIVRQRLPNISLGTVYRNLDLFRRQGLALELACGDFNRYDGDTTPHHHFYCQHCRRMWDVEATGGGVELAPQSGFFVLGQYTVFYGLCPNCASSAEAEEN